MSKRRSADSSRRNFLKSAGLAGAAAAMVPPATANAVPAAPQTRKAAIPGPRQVAAETLAPAADPVNQTSSGGDFMVDVFNSLGIEYLAINCASSYRGLHEAVVNHGNNKPEIITCVHEDIAVHLAQGYAKMSGRPMAMACHGVVGAAAAMVPPATANAVPAARQISKAAIPGPRQVAAETMPPAADPVNQTSSGGDFMVDVLNSLGIEYLAINCASSYRGLHEAVVNHGNNKPEILTCVHEDIAVHMAQGYAKIAGRPMAMGCHGVVGLQHAAMAI